ncbi:MAG TPA: hypothetical protein PLH27_06905 [bacterium]|nr:hypothetical protein [bacterium]HMW31763.1 hypothetical protein [bacterium]HMW35938.1 hypothetical protein [bacterium]HMY34943.1 hypothetical protein [bacterium]HMZ02909.1 hypothetical protein [bacterium]
MNTEQILNVIQESFDSLTRSGLIASQVQVTPDLVILGNGSPLDSMAFVTLFTDLEERIATASGKDIFLVLDEIEGFNINNPFLSAETIAGYIVGLIQKG